MTCAGLLLAAGASRRFGAANKLLTPLGDAPLICHAAAALRASGCAPLVAVTADPRVAALLRGFEIVDLGGTAPEQSDSLRAGIAATEARGASQVLIALGDMPFVTADHLRSVIARAQQTTHAATTDGAKPLPPACFAQSAFAALGDVRGDTGAASLLRALPIEARVAAPPSMLRDIDTSADLDAAQ